MINEPNSLINSPSRKIKCKVELFSSSTKTISGEEFTINDFYPIPEELNVSISGKNLFNIDTISVDTIMFEAPYGMPGYNTSDFIKVSPETEYVINTKLATYALFDIDKKCIGGNSYTEAQQQEVNVIKTIPNSKFIRFSYIAATANPQIQMELGTVPTAYVPFLDVSNIRLKVNDKVYQPDKDGVYYGVLSKNAPVKFSTVTAYADGGAPIITVGNYKTSQKSRDIMYNDFLQNITINRESAEGMFFGCGVSQKATVNILNKNNNMGIKKGDYIKVYFTSNTNYVNRYPMFFIDDIKYNDISGVMTLEAYDVIKTAAELSIADIDISSKELSIISKNIAERLGLNVKGNLAFNVNSINTNNKESLKEVLDDIAECYGDFYSVDGRYLKFNSINTKANVYSITKDMYFNFEHKEVHKIKDICATNELRNDITKNINPEGETVFIRNNIFLNDESTAIKALGFISNGIQQVELLEYSIKWRGNYCLEIPDCINIVDTDNKEYKTYLINSRLTYSGGLIETTKVSFNNSNSNKETANNPVTIGEAIKDTYAKVDKVNKEISLVAAESNNIKSEMADIKLKTDGIESRVSSTETSINNSNTEIESLKKSVAATMSAEEVKIEIQTELSKGTTKVDTGTGFTFDSNGLTIDKTGKEISTRITEDGMEVLKNNNTVLTANNEGVQAEDLHATTYLIIGNNSRFEDLGSDRTACFWIGR